MKGKQLDRACFKLQNLIFHIVMTTDYAFLLAINKNLHTELLKISTGGSRPLFHNCDESVAVTVIHLPSARIDEIQNMPTPDSNTVGVC